MSIGVKTAALGGQDRDFTVLGVESWTEAEDQWKKLGDLDTPGLFAYGNLGRWEVRLAGLDAGRLDTHKRSIRTSVILRGDSADQEDASLALGLARLALRPEGFHTVQRALAHLLTHEIVEDMFRNARDASVTVRSALVDLVNQEPPPTPSDLRGTWIGGANSVGAKDRVDSQIATVLSGFAGLAVLGETYVLVAPADLPAVVAKLGSDAPWLEVRPAVAAPPSNPPNLGEDPKWRRTIIPLSFGMIVLLLILLVALR